MHAQNALTNYIDIPPIYDLNTFYLRHITSLYSFEKSSIKFYFIKV